MYLKHIAAIVSLTVGLTNSAHSQTASETVAKGAPPRSTQGTRAPTENILARTVFQSLLGELALQRGDINLGVDAWADLAQRTRDPKVIERATEVAGIAKQYDKALALTRLWLEIEPESEKARQSRSSLLLQANRIEDLAPQLEKLLEKDKDNLANNLLQLNRLLARHSDKKAVLSVVERVVAPYLAMPEAHYAMAQAAAHAGDNMRALAETEKALLLRPDWEGAAVARAQIQGQISNKTAIDALADFVSRYPNARDARLLLARLQIAEKQFVPARQNFDKLLETSPENLDVLYPAAMLALQQGDAKSGRALLERLLSSDFPDKSTLHFFLGQLEHDSNNTDKALEQFHQVTTGDQYISARARIAQILMQKGKSKEAREILSNARTSTPAEKSQLILAETLLLRETGQFEEAYALLDSAVKEQPGNEDILYEAALMAERVGKPEILEAHLTRLLSMKPDHPNALNALGYSWADRNIRLGEAETLIQKALEQRPGDPFIMDSLGWVFFRQGKVDEALSTLEKAYTIRADPEIAAHLGEVLWTKGRREDARKIMQEAATRHPGNDVLRDTIKKLLR